MKEGLNEERRLKRVRVSEEEHQQINAEMRQIRAQLAVGEIQELNKKRFQRRAEFYQEINKKRK
jgi:hypothetical protein